MLAPMLFGLGGLVLLVFVVWFIRRRETRADEFTAGAEREP